MTQKLKGKVVLITGASSGFGQDAARLFAHEGASVVLAARRIDRMQAQVESLHNEGYEAMATPVDVTNRADVDNMVKSVIEIYERIDILFNNAGFGRLNFLEDFSPERDIETLIDVNLIGLIQVTRAVLPHMLAQKSGHIINMSSMAGWIATPTYTVYAATKFGVRGFTDALRREVTPLGIHVSGVYPGPSITEFGEHLGDSKILPKIKLPHWVYMSSDYVASQVVRLASSPRRELILPWWFIPIIWLDRAFPSISDWIQSAYITRFRK